MECAARIGTYLQELHAGRPPRDAQVWFTAERTEYDARQCELVHYDIPAEDEELSQGAFGLGNAKYYCAGCGPDDSTVRLGV